MAASWTVEATGTETPRFVVSGEFDLADEESFVADVRAQLCGDSVRGAELDFSAVDFIDSSGIRALMRLHGDHGGAIRLVAASRAVERVLVLAGIAEYLSGPPENGDET